MADLFEVLGADHAEYAKLIAALDATPRSGVGEDKHIQGAQCSVTRWLAADWPRHSRAEDEVMWPAVRQCLPAEQALVAEAISGGHEIFATLGRLCELRGDEPAFDRLVSELIAAGHRHIELLEQEIWPALSEVLTADTAHKLGHLAHQVRAC